MKLPLAIVLSCIALAATWAPSPAHAAPCAGFFDVDDSSAFCRNVEWIKNRGVTFGCDDNAYCPNEPVSRLAMAAFLHRLGSGLSTFFEAFGAPPIPFHDLDAGNGVICTAPKIRPPWSQRASGFAILTAYSLAGAADISVRFIESTDDGATWNDVSPAQAVSATNGIDSQVTLSVMLPPRDHVFGTHYSYALRVGRVPGSATTGDVGGLSCVMNIARENRNPATSPFDEGL